MDSFLAGDVAPQVSALVELGLNHEQQHQELVLTDVKHLLSQNPLQPAYLPAPAAATAPAAARSAAGRVCRSPAG